MATTTTCDHHRCRNNHQIQPIFISSHEQNKKRVNELVDESVKFLDICGSISEMLSEIKGHSRDLVCALGRRMGDHLIIENNIMKYNCFRKKLKKHVKGLITSLKQVDNLSAGGGSVVVDSNNHQLAAVIRAPNRWSIGGLSGDCFKESAEDNGGLLMKRIL
ncbi:hypothetical protein Hanom_Chr12g01128131 [Helianthus anomalus]